MVIRINGDDAASGTSRQWLACSKFKILLILWMIPVLFSLLRLLDNVHDYHEVLNLAKELDTLASMSSLWQPTVRNQTASKKGNRTITVASWNVSSSILAMKDNKVSSKVDATPHQDAVASPLGAGAVVPKTQERVIATKDYSNQSMYWRYDQAAPPIRYAQTHQLSSLPAKYRIGPLAFENLTHYLRQPEHQYPQKLHVFETNPSIAILPLKYQVPLEGDDNKIPRYLASYRFLHKHNCLQHNERGLMYGGGDWNVANTIKRTDYLGLALLEDDLTILSNVVVVVTKQILSSYEDYRLFTIHDQLYITAATEIARLELGLGNADKTFSVNDYQELEHLLDKDTNQQQPPPPFSVHIHRQVSCPPSKGGKNFLYFIDDNNQTVVEFFPAGNPNDIRTVELDKPCNRRPSSVPGNPNQVPLTASFMNYHDQRYPNVRGGFLTADRGSACCVRIQHQGQEYLVGVNHPKTPYPGKKLPKGVGPNVYFSRFFAMQASPPYEIVAKTGTFCLGYSHPDEVKDTLLWNEWTDAMYLGEASFDCPRIHFVLSIIENVRDPNQVIISYGVSDCTPRFITVDKVDIQAMLWPSSSSPAAGGSSNETRV